MSDSEPESSGDRGGSAIAKAATFLVFSGIGLSIIKALTRKGAAELTQQSSSESSPAVEPIVRQLINWADESEPTAPASSRRTIKVAKGETLWGLSRKYGVSVNAIKDANGLKGDTIYAGRNLIIP